jgi:hypothetical protein
MSEWPQDRGKFEPITLAFMMDYTWPSVLAIPWGFTILLETCSKSGARCRLISCFIALRVEDIDLCLHLGLHSWEISK